MANVMLRPDLKTAGGEVNDILFNHRSVGTLSLVYRENDRIAGALQLEQEVLSESEKEAVFESVHAYVQALAGAIQAKSCEVMATYGSYDHIIATESLDEAYPRINGIDEDFDFDSDWVDTDTRIEDEGPMERGDYSMADFELVVVGEADDAIEYHIYDKDEDWVAEVFLQIEDREVSGTVNWLMEPTEEELDVVADLLVLDFDDDQVDSFVIDMKFNHEIIETIELTHEDLLDEAEMEAEAETVSDSEHVWYKRSDQHDYSVMLVRDDGDVLTYEIYQSTYGGLPIGTATIDISQRQLTGFIDFRVAGSSDDRELIAMMLMQELDKEKDFDTINLSMMHQNRLIEEVLLETEQVH